jgi:hypothetical protein
MAPELNLRHCSKSQYYSEAAEESDKYSVPGLRHEPGVVSVSPYRC